MMASDYFCEFERETDAILRPARSIPEGKRMDGTAFTFVAFVSADGLSASISATTYSPHPSPRVSRADM